MSEDTPADEPEGADASPDVSDAEVTDEAEAEVAETEDQESEAESPPADEENVDETTDEIKARADALQDRIDKLTKNWRTTEREADDLRKQLDEANERLASAEKETPLKTLADFDHDEQAFTRYLLDESEKRAQRVARELVAKPPEPDTNEAESAYEAHVARERAFEAENPDYRRKVYDDNVKISQLMATEIEASDVGPDMAYYLASNPDISREISLLPQRDAIRRMVQLETEVKANKAATSGNTSTKAPPPQERRVKGGKPGVRINANDPKSDRMTDAEWLRRREVELAKKAG